MITSGGEIEKAKREKLASKEKITEILRKEGQMMAEDRETRARERAGEKRQDQETSEVVSEVKDLIKVLNTKQESEGIMSKL